MRISQIIFLSLLLFGCTKQVEVKPTYLTEKIEYFSKNILGFENLFGDGLNSQENVKIFGVLHFPDNYDSLKQYPAIVASHGSSNWRAHHLRYLEQMRQAGFIVLAMHPFDSRGVDSTVGNQINVTSETVIYDMAMSLNLLWDDSRFMQQVGVLAALQLYLMHGYHCRIQLIKVAHHLRVILCGIQVV
jgi:hypothetical protein